MTDAQIILAAALGVVFITVLGMAYAAQKLRAMHDAVELMDEYDPY